MLSKLFRKRIPTRPSIASSVPKGTVVWAVGDVHGRLDLLTPLVEAVIRDLQDVEADRRLVIFLGDYIDRGPDSRGVIRYLSNLPTDGGIEWRFLKGNHEQTMLDFLDDPAVGPRWCEYGGDRALQSYGLRIPDLAHKPAAWTRVAADLRHKLSARELAFMKNLELSAVVGDYFFSHAGARPGVALDRQTAEDLLWIRQPFLESRVGFDRTVVHGHTPARLVQADGRRIGIDTQAYASGVLTALRLEGTEQRIMQTVAPSHREVGEVEGAVPRGRPVLLRQEQLAGAVRTAPTGDRPGNARMTG